jgi:hypothetical protein
MNDERIANKVSDMKIKGKQPRGSPRSKREQQVRKNVAHMEEHGRELRRNFRKMEINRETWLLDNAHKSGNI